MEVFSFSPPYSYNFNQQSVSCFSTDRGTYTLTNSMAASFEGFLYLLLTARELFALSMAEESM
jgi:hypothetical protein